MAGESNGGATNDRARDVRGKVLLPAIAARFSIRLVSTSKFSGSDMTSVLLAPAASGHRQLSIFLA